MILKLYNEFSLGHYKCIGHTSSKKRMLVHISFPQRLTRILKSTTLTTQDSHYLHFLVTIQKLRLESIIILYDASMLRTRFKIKQIKETGLNQFSIIMNTGKELL